VAAQNAIISAGKIQLYRHSAAYAFLSSLLPTAAIVNAGLAAYDQTGTANGTYTASRLPSALMQPDANLTQPEEKPEKRLTDVAKLFLKLGIIGFGGPAVHIALMQEEVVRKRRWIEEEHFLDLVGATNLIPGPNSTELTMHIGRERAGWKGLIVAGCCFIGPAVLITALFAVLYQQYGSLPAVQPFIYGIKPAIIAVVASLMLSLGRKAVKTVGGAIIGVLAAAAVLLGLNEIVVLFAGGLTGILLYLASRFRHTTNSFLPFVLLQLTPAIAHPAATKLFWTFLKIGSILYGSGYVCLLSWMPSW
jgi:chromate transporter